MPENDSFGAYTWIYLERILDRTAPSLMVFMIVFLEQVQSIDYSGDEVQVTVTDGTGYTAQKVGARISLGAARGLGVWENRVFHQVICLWQSAWRWSPEDLPVSTQSCVGLQI